MNYPCSSTGQYLLFDEGKVLFKKTSKLWGEFLRYHLRNPHIYEWFRDLVLKLIEGEARTSGRLVLEEIRWSNGVSSTGELFKISNNHTPYYTRTFIEEFPEHKGRFVLRPISGD